MHPAVVVVGSFNQDLTWHCTEFPAPGATILGRFVTGPGGKGSNQAVAAARAGARTAFIGALGDDAFGRAAQAFLRAQKIAVHLAWKKLPTDNAAILVNRHGENQIIVALGANAVLAPRDVPSALITRARVVVCQHETNPAVNRHVFRTARRAGVTTVLNPAPMLESLGRDLLSLTDILVLNEGEFVALARRLAGSAAKRRFTEQSLARLSARKLHDACRSLGVATVVVTLGARGCFVSERERGTAIAPHRVKIADTTGAGDAFVGAFSAALSTRGAALVSAARFGNAAAALSVTQPGTAPSMPRKKAVFALLRRPAAGHSV